MRELIIATVIAVIFALAACGEKIEETTHTHPQATTAPVIGDNEASDTQPEDTTAVAGEQTGSEETRAPQEDNPVEIDTDAVEFETQKRPSGGEEEETYVGTGNSGGEDNKEEITDDDDWGMGNVPL